MTTTSLRLPESLHAMARELAAKEHISINQLITLALAEKVAALMTEEYIDARARRGSRAKFEQALARVDDAEPDDCDRV